MAVRLRLSPRGFIFDSERKGGCLASPTGSVVYWDVILILSAAVRLGLAIRIVARRSRSDRPAAAAAENALLEPARGQRGSAAI